LPVRKTTKSPKSEDGTAAKGAKKRATPAKPRKASPRKSASAKSSGGNGRALVIVESPAKAKTLQKYLGSGYKIEASVGHVKDLPTSKLGVDPDKDFEPQYVVLKGKEKVLERIRKSALAASSVYLAPDPDREGEAIAWHIAEDLRSHGVVQPIMRATFNEITKRAVGEAIANPQELDQSLFEAQQARRILDRLVGYKISPLLWAKVTRGLSAGRVQSVAVRLVVDREREIESFVAEEYWSLEADVDAADPPRFEMRLAQLAGVKPKIGNEGEAQALLQALDAVEIAERILETEGGRRGQGERRELAGRIDARWTVASVERKDVKRHPAPPFITSTLQQEAARKLGFGAKRTMSIAQRLYEGVELGEEGMTALITYMRTDSTRMSFDAVNAARAYIGRTYGPEYVPADPNFYKTKKAAQDAHEAIRPTDMSMPPQRVARHLDNDQLRLYELIWNRFIATQMADAILEQTRIESRPKDGFLFAATGLVQKFAGYRAIYEEGKDDGENGENGAAKLPSVQVGDELTVAAIHASQHFTQPPPRYSEATLVKELEKRGIGRPSTYASIVSTIQDKDYVAKDEGRKFRPTELGTVVTDLLVEHFRDILDVGFTAQMEERLDEVEEGNRNWVVLLHEFYGAFKEQLAAAEQNMKSVKREEIPTEIPCEKCGQANLVIKWGRNGRFLACPRYPECKNTMEYNAKGGEPQPQVVIETEEPCPTCGRKMIVKSGRFGRFLACPGYPECKSVKPFPTGVKCPQCNTGDLVERTSKRGKPFYSCSNYPDCKYVLWNRPIPEPCPKCSHAFLLERVTSKRRTVSCPAEGCKYHHATAVEGDPAAAQDDGEA
jgi:DNA topoisomerase-1